LQDELFRNIFPECELSPDSTSAKRFNTTANGSYFAIGAGGAITGRGAHVLLIDDPLKGREEAESPLQRQKLKDWFQSVAYTRLMPNGAIILVQTRWHDDDLAGWLLSNSNENWHVINMPAINNDGEPLWAEQYNLEALERIKKAIGSRDWSALYQQNPSPDDGVVFKRETFQYYKDAPPLSQLRIYGASDYAVTPDAGDYSVHIIVGIDYKSDIYVLDLWRKQSGIFETAKQQVDMMRKYNPWRWGEEAGVIQKAIDPILTTILREEKHFLTSRLKIASIHDKVTRSATARGRLEQGKIFFPRNPDWLPELESELLKFPAGKNDDMVDAFSLACSMLAKMLPAELPPAPIAQDIHGEGVNAIVSEYMKNKAAEIYEN
jgi:predicted phage terminase large subunit-like protein